MALDKLVSGRGLGSIRTEVGSADVSKQAKRAEVVMVMGDSDG